MSDVLKPDICVIGAGSGGLSVAAAAAAFGVSVVLIEKGEMGGDCLNYGCVPSKALLAAGKRMHDISTAKMFGIRVDEPTVNFRNVKGRVREVIETIAPMDSEERFTALGVQVIRKEGRFIAEKTVEAGDTLIKARRFVVATGSSPFVPPIPGLADVPHFTNETIFDETRKPGHLIIIGGGPIGMEMAQAHRRLGCDVTVIEGFKALGKDDPELAALVLDNIRNEGVEIFEDTKVVGVEPRGKSGVRVHTESAVGKAVVDGTHILVATGRAANVEGLGLDKAGIEYDRKGIKVTNKLRTSNKKVYAIGDVAGGLQFTHVAGYHAGLVIRAMLFRLPAKENRQIIPWVTYTDPELAHIGLSEEEARVSEKSIQILRWPIAENDRAVAEGKTKGLIKLIASAKGKILGVSIAGANAGELLGMWALAISKNMSVRDITGIVAPYPTVGEISKRAATSYYAPSARKPFVRRLIGFLRVFG
ncbi:MAG: FAD-dependent oxidoreductase [Pseudomonadota bacterium]